MYRNITALQKFKFVFWGLLLLLLSFPAAAQDAVVGTSTQMSGDTQFVRYVLYSFLGLLVLVLLLFVNTINNLLKAVIETQLVQAKNHSPEAAAKLVEIANRPSIWKKLLQKLTAAKPIENEHDILLDHDYDGIKELDNHLPPWWKYGFYLSIVVSVFYIINYHIKPIWDEGYSQLAEYEAENVTAEIAIAEYRKKAVDQVDESSVVQLTDAPSLGKGKAKFTELCMACHGDIGQGGIGPNLTDQFWLHGGDIKSVFTTIKYGVADKGMIAWKDEMKPGEMQAVASYILSLGGSNPPGAKEPQGELYIPSTDSTKTDSINNKMQVVNPTAKL
jgi:cytochrome c oxidase cbb3-type subunit 3